MIAAMACIAVSRGESKPETEEQGRIGIIGQILLLGLSPMMLTESGLYGVTLCTVLAEAEGNIV